MTRNRIVIVGALALSLGASPLLAEAGQRGVLRDQAGRADGRGEGARSGDSREREGAVWDQAPPREGAQAPRAEAPAPRDQRGATAAPRDNGRPRGNPPQAQGPANRGNQGDNRGYDRRGYDNRGSGDRDREGRGYDNRGYAQRGGRDRGYDNRRPEPVRPYARGPVYRYDGPRGYVRPLPRRGYSAPRGRVELYFGWGSGYRYGSPYSGRVYGYLAPVPSYGYGAYGSYGGRFYGDVRLEVRPRNAAVYVDGYYSGIVDDFDGIFQRLTIEVGPHRIDIEAPGFEPQSFDVYVDAERTIGVHADLYPLRP